MQEDRIETKPPASPIESEHQRLSTSDHPKSRWQRIFVWAALLLAFGVIFMLVIRRHEDTQSAPSSRRGVTGPVTVTIAVAQKGNIGVYLDAIGTVTPIIPTRLPAKSQEW